MLPVSALVNKETTYSIVDIGDEKEDCNKKEKKLEIIVRDNIVYNTIISIKSNYKITSYTLSSLFHTIETPPPDFV